MIIVTLPMYTILDKFKNIVESKGINYTYPNGNPILHEVLKEGSMITRETVEYLINQGFDINAVNRNGHNILQYLYSIIYSVDFNIYNILASTPNFNINNQDKLGRTVLHSACIPVKVDLTEYNYKYIEMLVKHGADINIKDNEGKTPLHYMCINEGKCKNGGSVSLLRSLDIHEAKKIHLDIKDVNVQDNLGNTPLHYLMMNESYNLQYSIMYLKSQRDLDFYIANNDGKTPMDYFYANPTYSKDAPVHIYNSIKQCMEDTFGVILQ